MDSQLVTVLFSIVASIVAIGGSWLLNRKYAQLGGGTAQIKLNSTYRELNTSFETLIDGLRAENETLKVERAGFVEERQALRAERLRLQQDIDDLRAEIRVLQRRVTKAEATTKRDEKRVTALEENGNGK